MSLFSLPLMLNAQSVDEMLQKVSAAIEAGQQGQAMSYFRQTISLNIDRTEMYYWTNIDKSSEISVKLANELAIAFRKKRNYDKAYLFYKELLQKAPKKMLAAKLSASSCNIVSYIRKASFSCPRHTCISAQDSR